MVQSDGHSSNGSAGHEVREHDVLIIGAGGAGLRAAIAATEQGLSVGVLSKSLLGKAHTVMAEGGIAASLGNVDAEDGWRAHFMDTMKSGKFINNWKMAEIFAKEAPDRVYELEQWGALFNRTPEGKISQRPFGAHTYRRLCHVGDRTGLEMIRTLQEKVLATDTKVYMETTVVKLFKNAGRVVGALAYTRETGKFIHLKAKAVVMATGGWGRIFKVTSNSWEGTGDGVVLAYDAGAELVDMEMVQFHPTGMVWPPGVRGLLVTEGVRGEGGLLKNADGERYMKNYDEERMELSSRDVVARANYTEVTEGRGSPHGGVYLDITHLGYDGIMKKLPTMHEQFLKLADIDISKEPMEVFPTIHYTMGGIKIDPETCATNVPGLYAAGEVAGGLHGANRLGGNSLSDLLVFGRRAGEGAAGYVAGNVGSSDVEASVVEAEKKRVLAPLERKEDGENPYTIQRELQEAMMEHANLMRNEDSLKEGLGKVLALKDRLPNVKAPGSTLFNPGWHTSQDIYHLIQISEIILRTALERKERRGAQWRLDYDGPDDELGKLNLIVTKDDQGEVGIEKREMPPLPDHLAQLFQEGGEGMTENNGSNGREEMASKAHADIHEDELATASGEKVRLNIFRGDSEGGKEVEYEIPAVEGMVVLDAVLAVQAYQAQDLAVRWNCKAAHCGSCSAEINGRPKLLCKTRVEEYDGQEIRIQPMRAFPIVKDLVSDVSWNYETSARIPPFNPGEEQAPFTMYEEDVERLYEPKSCIECFMCQDVCHVLRTHHKHAEFAGPRFFVRSQWLEMHPMDKGDRLQYLKEDQGGLGYCNITKCCTEVCPAGIKITDNSIIPLKERVADEYYDPAKWLMRKIRGNGNRPRNTNPEHARAEIRTNG